MIAAATGGTSPKPYMTVAIARHRCVTETRHAGGVKNLRSGLGRCQLAAIIVAGAVLVVSCAQPTETSTGVLEPVQPTVTAAPSPSPTALATTTPVPTIAPAPASASVRGDFASTPDSVAEIVSGERIAPEDLTAYIAFIEAKLERPVNEVPTVTGISREALLKLVPEGRFVPGDTWELLIALGLIAPDANRLAADEVRREDVRGSCCPIIVRDTGSAAFNEMLLVHELTHAADDPGGGLASLEALEFVPMSVVLVEGNAHRVAFDYANEVLASTYPDFELPSPVFTNPDHPDLPAAVRDLFEFPYEEGQQFARDLFDHGGEDAIVQAFSNPPSTSEHILDVESYLAGDLAKSVAAPPAPPEAEIVGAGTLGAFLLAQVLEQHLDDDAALDLASGWNGDGYTLFRQGQQRCISVRIEVETQGAVDALIGVIGADRAEEPLQVLWSRCSDEVPLRGVRPDS